MAEEQPPNATLYIKNLNENIKIPDLIDVLRETFSEFGNIIDIIAKKNLRAKGQAFIVFDSAEEAQDALDSLQGFDIFDKPMEIAFAKTRSDATVKKKDGDDGLEQHKRKRLAEKERKQAAFAAEATARSAKRAATENLAERPAKTSKPGAGGQLPDEFLPPNKILILRDLPDDYDKDALTAVFSNYSGFREIRMVPGRKGIAFAEYEDETGAIGAKEAMNGQTLGEKAIRVTFQRS